MKLKPIKSLLTFAKCEEGLQSCARNINNCCTVKVNKLAWFGLHMNINVPLSNKICNALYICCV